MWKSLAGSIYLDFFALQILKSEWMWLVGLAQHLPQLVVLLSFEENDRISIFSELFKETKGLQSERDY